MSSNKRTQSINKMNNYIWSFEGKCEGVNELNRGLITDYCRFTIMANELARLNQNHLLYSDAELSKTGVLMAKLLEAKAKAEKRKQ